MNYYKLKTSTPLGEKLKELLAQVEKCDAAADNLAGSIGAVAYRTGIDVDFGGISSFEFPNNQMPNMKVMERVDTEDGSLLYIPRVDIEEKAILSEYAEEYIGRFGVIVSIEERSFLELQPLFSRNYWAGVARVDLKEASVEQLLRKQKLSKEQFRLLMQGEVVREVFPSCSDELEQSINRSREEDAEIRSILGDKKFRLVVTITGCRQAVQLHKKMISLPVIPRGMTNALLGIDDANTRAGIAEFDGYIYVQSQSASSSGDLICISEEEFMQIREIMKASINKHPIAQA